MSNNWPGGLIRKTPVTPDGPYQDGAASGVWTLEEATYWTKQGLWPIAGNTLQRGIFGAGIINISGVITNTVEYINIATTGNSTAFGDLTQSRTAPAACSSATRGVFGAGSTGNNTSTLSNVMDYVTIASTGNAIDFGDLRFFIASIYQKMYQLAACSSSTTGIFAGGNYSMASSAISYITIASTGNSANFGYLTVARYYLASCSSSTRGLFSGGLYAGGGYATIDYVTIATTGNAVSFGSLLGQTYQLAGCSSSTRGVFGGGYAGGTSNVIQYVTIATTGDATDFGDLTVARQGLAACSSPLRGVFGGSSTDSTSANVLDYVDIATTGNAVNFGNLINGRYSLAACSSGHGGIA